MLKTALLAAALCCAGVIAEAHATQICIASHYGHGDRYNGRRTANGEIFDTYRHMTAAMREPQPFGSHVTVTNLQNGKSVTVRINDRGPFVAGRCVDLSYRAARAIGMDGVARVRVD